MKTILIVGQGPSKSGVGKPPLDGETGSGAKLAELAGITAEQMHEKADCVNLLEAWHSSNGKGDKFPMEFAKESAATVKQLFRQYKHVLLLGSNVAAAFGCKSKTLHWFSKDPLIAIVPHPSGVNRHWNEPANVEHAKLFLTPLFGGVLIRTKEVRAKFCTEYVERFDKQLREWWQVAEVLHEVERDQLFLEVGCKSFNDWLRQHAPTSYSFCYAARKRFLSLKEHVPMEDLKQIPSETADWASKAKNISPAALKRPEVIAALKNPKKKAIEALQKAAPDEHVEHTHNFLAKFSASQYNAVAEAYEAFKMLKDESASMEEFFEFAASEWFDSFVDESTTFRQRYHDYMSGRNQHDGKDQAPEAAQSAVAAV